MPRATGFPLAAAALVAVCVLSIAVGAKGIPLGDVANGLLHDDGSESAAIVRELRVPRTLVGLSVGVALGLAGALMQALTRNPLADPGLLGVEAGASAAVVIAIGWLGLSEPAPTCGSRSRAPRWPRSSCTSSAHAGGPARRRCGSRWPGRRWRRR